MEDSACIGPGGARVGTKKAIHDCKLLRERIEDREVWGIKSRHNVTIAEGSARVFVVLPTDEAAHAILYLRGGRRRRMVGVARIDVHGGV